MRLDVIVRFADNRSQHGEFIGVRCDAGKISDTSRPQSPILLKLKRTRHQRAWMPLPHYNLTLTCKRLSSKFIQRRFRIKCIDMADAATHEQ